VPWLVPSRLPIDFVLLAGDSGEGKTTVAEHLVGAIAVGGAVFGRFPVPQRPVLVITGEDGLGVWRNRLEAFALGHGWEVEDLLRNVHVYSLVDGDWSNYRTLALDDGLWQTELLRVARQFDVGAVFTDPLADLLLEDEDRARTARPTVRFFRQLVADGRVVFVLHHVSKPSGEANGGRERRHRIRGSIAWIAASRAAYWIERTPGGIRFDCLKLSRAPRPAALDLLLSVSADPQNPGRWERATLMAPDARNAAGAALSSIDLAVLAVLVKATNPPNSTDLRLLVRRSGARANNEEINASLASLRATNLIRWDRVGRAKAWHPTEEGRLAYAQLRGRQEMASELAHPAHLALGVLRQLAQLAQTCPAR
jgi:hypothetical protein